jgi:prevent-host-death family protein
MEYSVHEAKTHLSKLLQQAQAGETVVITSGREKKPIVRLVPVTASRLGWLEGLIPADSGDKVLEPMSDEELALYEGSESNDFL